MCGICGMVGLSDPELLRDMCDSIVHRGPDDVGVFFDRDVALGVRRLSIIDLVTGHQPIANEDESLWVVFNGEIYNFQDLRDRLLRRGHRFQTQTDTEVIVHAYEEYGDDCVKHFNGMFAFALWDKNSKELFIARDRVGEKPLFYWQNGNLLLFGSEIKVILQSRSFPRRVNPTAMYNLLGRMFIPGDQTAFEGIKRLPPGHILKYRRGRLLLAKYWDLSFSRKTSASEDYYCDQVFDLLRESVRKRMIADVPLGAFLSGGIDSSGIVGLMSTLSDRPIKTFAIGFADEEADPFLAANELPFARMVAERFGTEHYELVARADDLLAELPQMLWHFDEPYSGSLAQYLMSRLARQHVKVALGGLGGDELFGSYGRGSRLAQALGDKALAYQKLPVVVRTRILERVAEGCSATGLANGHLARFTNFISYASAIGRAYANAPEAPFTDKMKRELCEDAFLERVNEEETLSRLFQRYFDQAGTIDLDDRVFYVDFKTQLVDEYLWYSDILSMAHSLEMRVPYLDHELIEFVAAIPSGLRSRPDNVKHLLKKALARLLPQEVVTREKAGFALPYGSWLRGPLRGLIDECLNAERVRRRGYFKPAVVQGLVERHMRGQEVRTTAQLWTLLMIELWHQIYIDGNCFGQMDISALDVTLSVGRRGRF